MMRILGTLILFATVFPFPGAIQVEAAEMELMTITSPVFSHMGMIPPKYTCNGENVNPPLIIENIPEGTKSLALIVDDPDAPVGIWVHWLLWNIRPDHDEIAENSVPRGALQGTNDFRKLSYGGPCPPSGTHRYFFKLFALDTLLTLEPGARKDELEKAMSGHILEKAEIIGMYRQIR
jgi:Raf kinase inhibitor-like YbhB/YbcL family protein